jgi:hypothetical protein
VPQQLLQGADVRTVLEQMPRKAVPQGMAGGTLGDARPPHRIPDCPVRDRLVQGVASHLAAPFVHARPRGREHPLPGARPPLARQFVVECVRQLDPASTLVQVGPVLCAHWLVCARARVAHPHRLPSQLTYGAATCKKLHHHHRNASLSKVSQRRERVSSRCMCPVPLALGLMLQEEG